MPVPILPGCSSTGQIRSHQPHSCPVPRFVLPCHLQPLPGVMGRASLLFPEAQNLGGPSLGTSGLSCSKGQIPPCPIPNRQELGFGVNPEQCMGSPAPKGTGPAAWPCGGMGTGSGCRGAWSWWSPPCWDKRCREDFGVSCWGLLLAPCPADAQGCRGGRTARGDNKTPAGRTAGCPRSHPDPC